MTPQQIAEKKTTIAESILGHRTIKISEVLPELEEWNEETFDASMTKLYSRR